MILYLQDHFTFAYRTKSRFPGLETISGAAKIPSIIYYDRDGKVQAVGAEATCDEVYEKALELGWYKTEW